MFNLSKREKMLFYFTLIAIAVWIGHAFLIKPMLTKWKKLDEKFASDKLKLEKSERLIAKKSSIAGDYKKAASAVRMTGSEEEEMGKFLTEIESLANSSSVHINEIKPLPTKQLELYRKFYADLEVEGEMVQISDFMQRVQNSPHLLAIDRLSLGSKQAEGSILLKCRIVISKVAIL